MELPVERLSDNTNMATGVVVQNADGSTQQVPFDQLQQFDPLLYKQYIEGQAQPQAGLQSTQTSTAATGAQIPGIEARSNIEQIAAQGKSLLKGVNDTFKSASNKNGYVDPNTYNAQRKLLSALGTNGDDFDKNFSTYVDPEKKVAYDTTEGQGLKQKKTSLINNVMPQAQKLIDEYNGLQYKGPAFSALATNPLAPYLNMGGKERNYEMQRQEFIKSLQDTSKTTDFTGLGISKADIDSMVASIPSITDATDQAENKIESFNKVNSTLTGKIIGGKKDNTPKNGGDFLKTLLGNAGADIKDLVNTTLNTPKNMADAFKKDPQAALSSLNSVATPMNLLTTLAKGGVQELNQVLGEPLKGGDITGRIGQRAYEKPVTTALDVLPFLAAGKASLAAKAGNAGKAAEVAGATGETTKGVGLLDKILGDKAIFVKDYTKSILTAGLKGGPKGALKKMETAVAKGGELDWSTITKTARSEVSNKGRAIKTALEDLIAQETPAKLGNAKLSSVEGWDMRKGLRDRLNVNYFDTGAGKTVPGKKAVEILRRAVSNELKKAAPGMKEADRLYSHYKAYEKNPVTKYLGRSPGGVLRNYLIVNKLMEKSDNPIVQAIGKSLPL